MYRAISLLYLQPPLGGEEGPRFYRVDVCPTANTAGRNNS